MTNSPETHRNTLCWLLSCDLMVFRSPDQISQVFTSQCCCCWEHSQISYLGKTVEVPYPILDIYLYTVHIGPSGDKNKKSELLIKFLNSSE